MYYGILRIYVGLGQAQTREGRRDIDRGEAPGGDTREQMVLPG